MMSHDALRCALRVFGCLFLFYFATAEVVLEHGDDLSMVQVTAAIVTHRTFAVPPRTPGGVRGFDGRYYSKYSIGKSLLQVPFWIAGRPFRQALLVKWNNDGFDCGSGQMVVVQMLDHLSVAATAALVLLLCNSLGCTIRSATLTALAFGVGTIVWHYDRSFMSEPNTMFALALTVFGLVHWRHTARDRWLWLAGAAAALAFLIKAANLILIVPVGLWMLWEGRRRLFTSVLAWAAPLAAALVIFFAYNWLRFRSIFETGYGAAATAFTTPLHVGLVGLLLSPGKGYFAYSPLALAALWGWRELRHRQPSFTIAMAGMMAVFLAFHACFYNWSGAGAWGPRFLVPATPFVMLGLGPRFDRRPSRFGMIAISLLAAVSLLVQVASVAISYVPYEASMNGERYPLLIYSPKHSPVVVHLYRLFRGQFDLNWAAHSYHSSGLAVLQISAGLAALLLAASLARSVMQSRDDALVPSCGPEPS